MHPTVSGECRVTARCADVIAAADNGGPTALRAGGSSVVRSRKDLYVLLHCRRAQISGRPLIVSVSCLAVTFEQFSLAVRCCPDHDNRALLMKVGYPTKSCFRKGLSICAALRTASFVQAGGNLSCLNFVLGGDKLVTGR